MTFLPQTRCMLLKSGGTDYDVLFPSDYMIARLVNEDASK